LAKVSVWVVNERLLEVPLLLLGVAWIGLGVVVAHDTLEAESRPHGWMLHRHTSASRGDSS